MDPADLLRRTILPLSARRNEYSSCAAQDCAPSSNRRRCRDAVGRRTERSYLPDTWKNLRLDPHSDKTRNRLLFRNRTKPASSVATADFSASLKKNRNQNSRST